MNKLAKLLILVVLAVFFVTGNAFAAYTTVLPGTETPLEGVGGVLDTIYGWGNVSRIDDAGDIYWNTSGGIATARWKSASYAENFGIVEDKDLNGSFETFSSLFTVVAPGGPSISPTAAIPSISGNFLFGDFITQPPNDQWASLPSFNPDGMDHMVTYLVTGGASTGNYVIAFEDVDATNPYFLADWDYNDLVVEIAGANPVPEPATLLLLGTGLIGIVGFGRRNFDVS